MVTLSFKTIMAKVNEIAKLFQAISDRDWNRAHAIAAKMIAEEERKGNRSAAQTLEVPSSQTVEMGLPATQLSLQKGIRQLSCRMRLRC